MNLEDPQIPQMRLKIITFYGYFKLIAMLLLIGSEYLFFTSRICLNESTIVFRMYPYAAFFSAFLQAVTFISFLADVRQCDIFSWITTEVLSSFINLTVMIWVCTVTLLNCERPLEVFYFLPEIIGLAVSTLLLLLVLFWFWCFYSPLKAKRHPSTNFANAV